MRRLRVMAMVLVSSLAVPASAWAQMNFDGLDVGTKKKKATKKKKLSGDEKKPDAKDDPNVGPGASEGGAPPAAVDAAAPAAEKKPVADTKPAPTMSFDAVEVAGKTGDRQKVDQAISAFKAENYETAAVSFFDMSQDPKLKAMSAEAEYWLAKSLYKIGMYHGSLETFSRLLARGDRTKFFKSSLEWLFFISRKTVNETVVLDEIQKYSNFEFPERFRSEFRYLLARYNFVRGKALDENEQKGEADKAFEEVRKLCKEIKQGDPFYPRAKYLEGLSHFRDGKLEVALDAMKTVVRETRDSASAARSSSEVRNNQTLRELAFMQLARTHYGAKQNRYAIFYFSKIERGGPQWLEALFESSWANYRIGQSEQALGNLITLSSPFFRDEYFPEALILKAVIYFENCRYREALSIIEDFERIYGPVQTELEDLVAKNMEATEYFNVFEDVRKKNKSGAKKTNTDIILERILNLALTDKDLKKTVDSITELEGEIDSFSSKSDTFKYSSLSKSLIEELKVQRSELLKRAGIMAKTKLDFELGQLRTMRGNGIRIHYETTSKEKEYLEQQLGTGGQKELVKSYQYSVAVSDDQLYWPYVGEYWRDELGTYQYTLTKGCIERSSPNTRSE